MEQEKIDLLLRAAKVLQDKKEFYDYMVLVLPVVTAVLGWFAAIWWQSYTFKKNSRKEHYYTAREKVESISESFNKFLECLYTFYKNIKNIASRARVIDDDVFNDFITEYQFMLDSIYQKLRIIFPGKHFPIEQLTKEMKIFENNIKEINGIVKEVRESKPDMNAIDKRVEDLNNRNSSVISHVTTQVSRIQNIIIDILDNKAKELGIKE
ncbi:MAG TPA: hypothetical protein ACFYEF_05755 [Candidatus Wunengus sp. YC63]|uniref:hypothetical protein n=1 Tax=unclassified Candidatus Wunengus TaxID=3367695 RepID=UPI0027122B8E|nr:hypothetical protein [Candidatus Brocadiales bacterium]